MKTIIAGGRDFYDWFWFCEQMAGYASTANISEVVSGCAQGADAMGERFARRYNIPIKEFPANWSKHGNAAGPIRNAEMAKYAEALIAFWDGKSKGTTNMIETATKLGLKVTVFSTSKP